MEKRNEQTAARTYTWILTSYDPEGDFDQEKLVGTESDAENRLREMVRECVREEEKAETWTCDSDLRHIVRRSADGLKAYLHFHRKGTDSLSANPSDIKDYSNETETIFFAKRLDLMETAGLRESAFDK